MVHKDFLLGKLLLRWPLGVDVELEVWSIVDTVPRYMPQMPYMSQVHILKHDLRVKVATVAKSVAMAMKNTPFITHSYVNVATVAKVAT